MAANDEPLGSQSPQVLLLNSQNFDIAINSLTKTLWPDRFGKNRKTWRAFEVESAAALTTFADAARQALASFGLITLKSFQAGAPLPSNRLTLANQVLFDEVSQEYYRWDGPLPKAVPAGSTPAGTGGIATGAWVGVGYAALSSLIINATGSAGIETALSDLATAAYSIRNRRLLGVANNKLRGGEAVNIVCVGDSITYGYDVTSSDIIPPPADGGHIRTRAPIQYPVRMQERLNKFTRSVVTVKNYGFSGDTAKQCFNRWTVNPGCHVAHIMLGINDANGDFTEYGDYIEKLIRRYIDWGHGVVIHTSTAQTYNNGNAGGARFTQYARVIAASYGCPVFESEGVHQYCRYDSVYSDGTHFNKAGYAKYGDAVAAFILASGWVREVRPVSSPTNHQPGRSTEGIGWYSAGGAYLSTNISASYQWNGQTGGIIGSSGGIHSFSFFLDTDAANIYIVGKLPGAKIHLSDPVTAANGVQAVNRIQAKSFRKTIAETTDYQVSTRPSGYKSWVGSLVGRGWKTVYVEQDVASAEGIFCNQLIIEPTLPDEVVQLNSGVVPARKEIQVYKTPVADITTPQTTVPSAVKMPSRVIFPLPKGLYRQTHNWTSFYDMMKFEIDITTIESAGGATNNGTRKMLCRPLATTGRFSIETLYTTVPGCIQPSLIQYGWEEPNDTAGTINVGYPTSSPQNKLMYLLIDFPDAPEGYFSIEVECSALLNSNGNFMY
ncbi:phage tail protein [Escherichia coli]|nr:phage tail protein [Escherichia coli]